MTAIAAVLHLGNIAFQENEMTEEASILDPGTANLAAQVSTRLFNKLCGIYVVIAVADGQW